MSNLDAPPQQSSTLDEAATDRLFKALGHRTRRALLDLLSEAPKTTGELCAAFPQQDRCTTMQHLGVLEKAGLVIAQRRGRERWNHLNVLPIKHVHDRWIADYAVASVQLLAALADETGPASQHEETGCRAP